MLASHRTRTHASARILLVDDEDILSWCIDMELAALGFEVRTASSLKMAHETLETFEPDLIICDQGLPDGWGTEFIKRLKHPVPVIMITAYTPPCLEDLHAGGIKKLLRKPFDLSVLTGEVQHHLSPPSAMASNPCPPAGGL
ncbi:MAG TPA: response regulator [Oligoflexus sp.]|uniref:response regulator n=1 Tax=Oligoflexus sp. TaxID=1971216 RepID=UPI002D67DFD4|nr:response regulator [Oligoflexus sp.]HYX32349.1 response regulator [Oligoflexus sp.]